MHAFAVASAALLVVVLMRLAGRLPRPLNARRENAGSTGQGGGGLGGFFVRSGKLAYLAGKLLQIWAALSTPSGARGRFGGRLVTRLGRAGLASALPGLALAVSFARNEQKEILQFPLQTALVCVSLKRRKTKKEIY
jgi:hypothetical protein